MSIASRSKTVLTVKYRSDIDGLRALAVAPVVAFHAGLPGLAGGFVGVDVFFVISGYLICGMIAADIEHHRFSLLQFYKRRVMRIFPALFVMFLTASVLSYLYLLPVELKDYSKSLLSAVLSVSNVYFSQTIGYFDAPAATKPLLHTWSLGVEEQFYMVCPLLMIAAYRYFRMRVAAVIAICAALSFLGLLLINMRNPVFAFYLTPFRAWELLLGALLSLRVVPKLSTARYKEVAGLVGVAAVIATILGLSSSMPPPATTTLACFGAALIIASSETGLSIVGRALSTKGLVFIGRISYSLYLWHWLFIVFQNSDSFLFERSNNIETKISLIAVSVLTAYLSWRFIETPFRRMTPDTSLARVFRGAFASMAAIMLLAVAALSMDGAPFRFPGRVNAIASYLGYDPGSAFRVGRCYLSTNRQTFDAANCLKKAADRKNYLLVGDSHAAHLWFGLQRSLPEINVMQASATMCRPVMREHSSLDTRACGRLMQYVFDDYLVKEQVDEVLLSASWKEEDLAALSSTIERLVERGLKVVVLGPIVEYDRALPRLLVDSLRRGDDNIADSRKTAGVLERDRRLRDLVAVKGARYVSVYDAVCGHGPCETFAEGDVPLQFDAGHLTAEGSIKVARQLVEDRALP
jgi:peptidoglycan/LPS O-acetylase OafA/YrhL